MPGTASSAGDGLATIGYSDRMRLTPLTVGFHEPQFLQVLNAENGELLQFGQPAQWSSRTRQRHNAPMGPANSQALNRYAYCLNNPLRYVDPSGHDSGGNDDIGYEQVYDENGNPLKIDGRDVYKVWYFGTVRYIRADCPDLAVFMMYANEYAGLIQDMELQFWTVEIEAAAAIGGGVIFLLSPVSGPFAVPTAVSGFVVCMAAGFLTIVDSVEYMMMIDAANKSGENAWDKMFAMLPTEYNVTNQVLNPSPAGIPSQRYSRGGLGLE